MPSDRTDPLNDSITLTLTRAGPKAIQLRSTHEYLGRIECQSRDAADFIEAFLRRLVREARRAAGEPIEPTIDEAERCLAGICIPCERSPGHDGEHFADDDGRIYRWGEESGGA